MASLGTTNAFPEGHATNRPPLFDGINFSYWKARMRVFLLSTDYDVWQIVESGYHEPTITTADVTMTKPKDKWDINDKKLYSLNAKAMNALYCSLTADEFNRVSSCVTAQEIWQTLETTHEGTSQVKEAKLEMLISKYENFEMKSSESIPEMFTRFTDIVNKAKALGRDFNKDDLIRKILRSLPSEWDPKVTAIEESHDLSKMSLDHLVGNLITHETRLKERGERKEEEPKKKNLALKAKQEKVNKDLCSSSDEGKADDVSLIARGFKNFLRSKDGQRFLQNKRSQRNFKVKKNYNDDSDTEIVCHRCRKTGHFRKDCPQRLKDQKNRNRSFKATTWDLSSDDEKSKSSTSEDEVKALMANSDSSDGTEDEILDDEVYPSYNELYDKYIDMLGEFEKLVEKYNSLKRMHSNLKREKEDLNGQLSHLASELTNEQKKFEIHCTTIVSENELLKSKIVDLEKAVKNFSLGSKGLNMLLSNQRFAKSKTGLGYSYSGKEKKFQPSFMKGNNLTISAPLHNASSTVCFLCGKIGHLSYSCRMRYRTKTVKQIWVPKGTIPNQSGPFWIPRSHITSFL